MERKGKRGGGDHHEGGEKVLGTADRPLKYREMMKRSGNLDWRVSGLQPAKEELTSKRILGNLSAGDSVRRKPLGQRPKIPHKTGGVAGNGGDGTKKVTFTPRRSVRQERKRKSGEEVEKLDQEQ